ncbi:MAG TPA: fibrillarin-like rRNA/tRNA 2'-O-methyltransferase [Candidatus Poseidoniales archaeon]|nr:MAG TPA: fibrillarin-like rRNA/tRNA 2'-O-methyltransferase [Candidatus Poseidoniales archaeon]|tara:strand:+ start:149 stop:835 length:687 start_codon:yes stop_codon:yes gene_type:complete
MLSWAIRLDGRTLWSENAVFGASVYGESLRKFSGTEYRRWDPTRSKLAAAILRTKRNKSLLLPEPGSTVLYLGAGHGTSISHLHDHLCGADNDLNGRIVAVDLAPRCLRDLTYLARSRTGLVPILGDARKHTSWGVLVPHPVNWLFQDVAQSGQVEIFVTACRRFLNLGGLGLLSLKAASERWTGEGEHVLFNKVATQLTESGFEVEERIKLTGYEDNHVLFVTRRVE